MYIQVLHRAWIQISGSTVLVNEIGQSPSQPLSLDFLYCTIGITNTSIPPGLT